MDMDQLFAQIGTKKVKKVKKSKKDKKGKRAKKRSRPKDLDAAHEEESAPPAPQTFRAAKPAKRQAVEAEGQKVAAAAGAPAADGEDSVTFESLGLEPALCESIPWSTPTKIQREAIGYALAGRDIVGLAETGSGKTGAFALPVLHSLLDIRQTGFACVLTPTRELAFQISEQFETLGSKLGVKTAVIVGGVDLMTQALALARKPHIIVATPGRLLDHLENTKGFSLRSIKYLIMDEADRMLSLDFEEALNKILTFLPSDRRTFLFSATMTSKVEKLQRASLRDPVKVEVSSKYQTVSTLVQQYKFVPENHKEVYLVHMLNDFAGRTSIIFVATCATAEKLPLLLDALGFSAVTLHGQMSQSGRLAALNKFKSGRVPILVATDVAARGLDIPSVDCVINFDVPTNGKDYVHRVGRTARAGRSGRAVTLVTQYSLEPYVRIEKLLAKKLEEYPSEQDEVMTLQERVAEASRLAASSMREAAARRSGRGGGRRAMAAAAGGDGIMNGGDGFGGEMDDAAAAVSQSVARKQRIAESVRRNSKKTKQRRR